MIRLFIIFLLCLFTINCSPKYIEYHPQTPTSQRSIRWQEYSETALVIAKSSKRPVFIYFHFEGCVACQEMEERTFKDPEVVFIIMENYVPIRIEANQLNQQEIINKFDIHQFPSIILLSSFKNNMEIARINSFIEPQLLSSVLNIVKAANTMLDDKFLENLIKSNK